MNDGREKRERKVLDVTGDECPLTYVKTKLKLEEMDEGEVLEVLLNEGEAVENVPRSVRNEGHQIIGLEKRNGGGYSLFVQKENSPK